jgi:hypothetical protein
LTQFTAIEDGTEVNGETVLAIVDGAVMKDKVHKMLEKHGISSPEPGRWYAQQALLDVFREIAENIGPRMLHAIGSRIPDNAKFPSGIASVEEALEAIDIAFHMNHRNGDFGRYKLQTVEEHHCQMICSTPYPCDFDRGIIQSMAMRHLPRTSILVYVEHAHNSGCRKNGDAKCVYDVTW